MFAWSVSGFCLDYLSEYGTIILGKIGLFSHPGARNVALNMVIMM